MKVPFRLNYQPARWLAAMVLILVTIMDLKCQLDAASMLGDACDWTGSGLSSVDSGRSVTPVYLRCSQGHVTWVYPRGALRVLLRLGASGRDFRGCIKVNAEFKGARLFLEGTRSLSLLHSNEDAAPKQLARCFQSRNGQVALYVEADSNREMIDRKVASFSYDLQALARGQTQYDADDECRPCFPEEMVRLYCTSDFVARGIITGVLNNDVLERAEVSTRVSNVYRQLHHDIFRYDQSDDAIEQSLRHKNQGYQQYQLISTNIINVTNPMYPILNNIVNVTNPTETIRNQTLSVLDLRDLYNENYQYGTVYVPLRCEAKFGVGEFIFMGRMVLGDPILSCSPRLEDWVEIRRKAIKSGEAQCLLET